MADPRDFLLNTDYEMDKIVYFTSGSFTKTTTFSHGLNFAPLIFGVWSTDENFSSSNPLGMITGGDPADTPPLGVYATVEGLKASPGSESKIRISAHGEGENTAKIYYRVYAFIPPEYSGETPTTSEHGKEFALNTDYNYRKLMASGTFTQNGEEYSHNLGYYPHVMAWMKWRTWYGEDDNQEGYEIDPLVYASEYTNVHLDVTTSKIKIAFPSSTLVEKVYWRIYYDET